MSKNVSKKALIIGLVAIVAVVSSVMVFGSDSSIFQGLMKNKGISLRHEKKAPILLVETSEDATPTLADPTFPSDATPTLADPTFPSTSQSPTIPYEKCEELIKLLSMAELTSTISGMDTEIRNCSNSYRTAWTCANFVGNYKRFGGINPAYYDNWATKCETEYPEIWGQLPPKEYECYDLIKLITDGDLTPTMGGEIPMSYLNYCRNQNGSLWNCATIVGSFLTYGGSNPYLRTDNTANACANDYPEIWGQLPTN